MALITYNFINHYVSVAVAVFPSLYCYLKLNQLDHLDPLDPHQLINFKVTTMDTMATMDSFNLSNSPPFTFIYQLRIPIYSNSNEKTRYTHDYHHW